MAYMKFSVIDPKTGEYPDLEHIALHEDWADGLMWCDMEGFMIGENGELILADECGNFRYCPVGRFDVKFADMDSVYAKKYNRVLDVIATVRRNFEEKPQWGMYKENPRYVYELVNDLIEITNQYSDESDTNKDKKAREYMDKVYLRLYKHSKALHTACELASGPDGKSNILYFLDTLKQKIEQE